MLVQIANKTEDKNTTVIQQQVAQIGKKIVYTNENK